MAQLIVRNIEDDIVKALKKRAAEAGVSAEEEHRRILRQALKTRRNSDFLDHLLSMPDVGDDADFERPLDMGRPPVEF